MAKSWHNYRTNLTDVEDSKEAAFEEWIKTVPKDFQSDNYDLQTAYEKYPFEELEAWRKDPENNHLKSVVKLDNGDYMFLKLGKITNKVLQAMYELADDVIDPFEKTCDAEKDYKRAEQQQEYFEHQLEESLKGYKEKQDGL